MYTEQELKKAADIIKKVAEDNNVSEDQVRADMQEAMDCGRNCPDPIGRSFGKGFTMQDLNRHWRSLFFGLRLYPSKHRRLVNIVR